MKTTPDKSFFQSGCFIGAIMVVLVLIMGATIFYFAVWRIPVNKEAIEKNRLKAESRLDTAQATPDNENGWKQILEALKKFRSDVKDSKGEPGNLEDIYVNGLTPDNINTFEKLVQANNETIDLLEKAIKKEECVPLRDYRRGIPAIFPEESLKHRSLTHLLILMGDEEAKKSNYKQAAERYMQALFMANVLSRIEDIIFQESGYLMSEEVFDHLKPNLVKSDCDKDTYELILRQMIKIDKKHPHFRSLLENELINSHYSLSQTWVSKAPPPNRWDIILMKREYSILNSRILEILDVEKMDYRTANYRIREQYKNIPMFSMTTEIMIDRYNYLYIQYVRNRVMYGGMMILVALRCYRKDHRKYPDKLADLVPGYLPELPPDYFSKDKQFIYRKNGEKFVLYSIGNDLKDDSGKTVSSGVQENGDIVF